MKRWMGIVLGASVILGLVFVWRTGFEADGGRCYVLFDDAMISMRYARNLVDGHGLVWNPGEEPVEGYSNFLWVLWMAALHLLPLGERMVSLAVMLSGVAVLAANLWVVAWLADVLGGRDDRVTVGATALTAFFFPLIFWTLRGTEVGLLTLALSGLSLAGALLLEEWRGRRLAVAAVLGAGAVLVRDDALPALLGLAVLLGWRLPGRRGLVAMCAIGGAGLAAFLGHGAMRLWYYGDFLPNTYYLKLGGVPLWDRWVRGSGFLRQVMLIHLALPGALAALYVWRARRAFPAGAWIPVGLVAIQSIYSVWVGGDAWEWLGFANRYLAVAAPGLMVLAALGLRELAPAADAGLGGIGRGRFALLCLAAVAVGLLVLSGRSAYAAIGGRYSLFQIALAAVLILCGSGSLAVGLLPGPTQRVWRAVGSALRHSGMARGLAVFGVLAAVNGGQYWNWLREGAPYSALERDFTRTAFQVRKFTGPQARVAVVWAGIPGYFLGRQCVDLLGKNDARIARSKSRKPFVPGHSKWDYAHSIGELRPDLVWELWPPGSGEYAAVLGMGYVALSNRMLIRGGSPHIDHGALDRMGIRQMGSQP